MKLPWNDPKSDKFATTIGLITSDGPLGPNIMACEWTHHLSYDPGLIAISLGFTKATVENIRSLKNLVLTCVLLINRYYLVWLVDIVVVNMTKLMQ